jgi:hypothetical protein
LAGVDIILPADVLALEEQLQFRGEIGDALGGSEDGLAPRDPDPRVASVDPGLPVTFGERHVETPWTVPAAATPEVVLIEFGAELLANPGLETSCGGNLDVPAVEKGTQAGGLPPGYADIGIVVVAPGPADMEF